METIPLPPEAPLPTESSQPHPEEKKCSCPHKKYHNRGKIFFLIVLSLLFGLLGGILSPYALTLYQKQLAKMNNTDASLQTERIKVIAEDNVVADLVDKNSAGVVSISISKNIPKSQSFFGDPFNGFPFNPFGIPDQNQNNNDNKQQVGSGSGFFVSSDGLIVTNKHVVSDMTAEYTVIIRNKDKYTATVLARDPSNDIAILKINGQNFPALNLGDSDKIRVGETAIAIGNPLGEFANSVSKGIVSGLQRSFSASGGFGESERLSGIIQTDAAINPGNSGGPLFNLSGEIIGVNVAVAQGAQNIGFALPINQVKSDIEQIKAQGKISVPFIGVRHIMLNQTIAKSGNLPIDHGALIVRGEKVTDFAVLPGSPADKAGLMENDIILQVNGADVTEENPLSNAISKYKVGDEINLKVWHKGEMKDVQLKLEERQQ